MFLCICMSPAVDATVTLPHAPVGKGEIFKDVAEVETIGGKAVNAARWLALRGANVVCGGMLGEDNDSVFVRELKRLGVENRFTRIPGSTRRNETLVWPGECGRTRPSANQEATSRNETLVWPGGSCKLNRAAFPGLAPDKALAAAQNVIPASTRGLSGGVAILSGSLPPSLPADFYARAISSLKAGGWTTVLDTSGEALRRGLEAGPDLVKPNKEECEELAGFALRTSEDFIRATSLLKKHARHAIISAGHLGAWFDGRLIPAPETEVLDTTGAGDTLLAEYCLRLFDEGLAPDEAAKWAVAAGSAACSTPGGAPPSPELVAKLKATLDASVMV